MIHTTDAAGAHRLVIGPAHGRFAGQLPARAYELRIHAASRPHAVSVDGGEAVQWTWSAAEATAIVPLPRRAVTDALTVRW
jgi:hypothetical protein